MRLPQSHPFDLQTYQSDRRYSAEPFRHPPGLYMSDIPAEADAAEAVGRLALTSVGPPCPACPAPTGADQAPVSIAPLVVPAITSHRAVLLSVRLPWGTVDRGAQRRVGLPLDRHSTGARGAASRLLRADATHGPKEGQGGVEFGQ